MVLNKKHAVHYGALLVSFCLIAYGMYGLIQRYQATHSPDPVAAITQEVTYSTDSPDETPISDDTSYIVADNHPRRIIIDTIRHTGFVQRVGIDQENRVAVPNNVHVAGWFTGSVLPGEPGVSLIDGHVSGRYTDGVFKRLGQLAAGDQFEVEFGNLSRKTFEVLKVSSLSVDEATAQLLAPEPNVRSQLNLITCDGPYNAQSQSYDKRIIVVSRLKE